MIENDFCLCGIFAEKKSIMQSQKKFTCVENFSLISHIDANTPRQVGSFELWYFWYMCESTYHTYIRLLRLMKMKQSKLLIESLNPLQRDLTSGEMREINCAGREWASEKLMENFSYIFTGT